MGIIVLALVGASVFVVGQKVVAKDGNGGFQIRDSYIEVQETDYPQNVALVKKENGKEEITGQVKIVDQYLISEIPENEFLDEYSYLKSGFQDLSISIEADQPLFNRENYRGSTSIVDKFLSLFGKETLPEYRITKEIDKSASVQTELDLSKITLTTSYQESGIWNLESGIKQTLTLTNNSEEDLNLALLLKNQIEADKIYWNDTKYAITENPRKFVNPDKIAFYTPSEEYLSFYDFSDVPEEFEPELWAENKDGQPLLILSLNVSISAHSSKTIDPEYSSLKAKEELPEKTTISSKTYIKTRPDLTRTLAWEGTVGARYFKDNGQWYSHLLIDDRPNKVVLRNAKVAVEVYPGFAKYFDVAYQEERVKKEEWLLERKIGEHWEKIELGSPAMEIIQGEHSAGDYIGVKKIYNTAFGIFEIEYFLRDGNALKHTITFQNTSGKTETFRVIQKWEGIAGDKVNGQDVPLETNSPYLAFHYAKDSPKDFTVSENLSSMVFNEDGTEKTDQCLQRSIKIDKDIQGMKADFIYGNWVLAHNKSLEVDPATATLDDPSVDGEVGQSGAYNTPWDTLQSGDGDYSWDSGDYVMIHIVASDFEPCYTHIRRFIVVFNTSSLPDDAELTAGTLSLYGRDKDDDLDDPAINIYSSAPVSNTALEDGDFNSLGTTPLATEISYAAFSTTGYNVFTLNAQGLAAISKIGYTKLGARESNFDAPDIPPTWSMNDASSFTVYCEEKGTGYKPTLYVEYTPNQAPTAPQTPHCEGFTTPVSDVTDQTPEFSAIFDDPNTGNHADYYEIEVDTSSNFDGTRMWDTGKAYNADQTAENARCADISYGQSFTETLRPNAAGDETSSYISQYPAFGAHWDKVDEATSDNDTTYIRVMDDANQYDLYALPNPSLSGTINSVTVYIRCRQEYVGSSDVKTVIKTEATEYYGTLQEDIPTSYTPYSTAYTTNPNTSSAWTWTQIDALQAGAWMTDGGANGLRCTQVYVKVDYTPSATTLENNKTYHWRIKFWDNYDAEGAWSATQQFATASSFTVSLGDPTEDGDIELASGEYYRDKTDDYVRFEKHELDWIFRGYVEWDISSLSGTITKVEFRYHGKNTTSTDTCYIYAMANQPSAQSDDNAGNQVIYDDASDGTAYLSNDATFPEVGTGKDVGGASGPSWDTDPTTDLQTAVTAEQSWFAFGFKTSEATSADEANIYSEDKDPAADPKPTLYVTYTYTANQAPSFINEPYEDSVSTNGASPGNPTNAGETIYFKATAHDPNDDQYYLIVCKNSDGVTAGDNTAPTCDTGDPWCVSSAPVDSDAKATNCSYATSEANAEENDWWGYVCDKVSGGGACSAASQGDGTPAGGDSPFYVNHGPDFEALTSDTPVNPKGAGSDYTITWSTDASTTDDDTNAASDTVRLIVCKTNDGITDDDCNGGESDRWCRSDYVANSPSCTSDDMPDAKPDGTYHAYGYLVDNHHFAAVAGGAVTQGEAEDFIVSNIAPSIVADTINLIKSGGGEGNLVPTVEEGTTEDFKVQFIVTDYNSCLQIDEVSNEISSAIIHVYRSGIAQADCDADAEDDDDSCYANAQAGTGGVCAQDTEVDACNGIADFTVGWTCEFPLQYHADPTVDNSKYPTEAWSASAQATDDDSEASSLVENAVANDKEMDFWPQYKLTQNTIAYGAAMKPADKNDPLDKTVEVVSTGNVGLDTTLYGVAMDTTPPGSTPIPVGNQKYAASGVVYASGVSLAGDPGAELELHSPKTTDSGSGAHDITQGKKYIYWGIEIPDPTIAGVYGGTNTIVGITSDETSNW